MLLGEGSGGGGGVIGLRYGSLGGLLCGRPWGSLYGCTWTDQLSCDVVNFFNFSVCEFYYAGHLSIKLLSYYYYY